MYDIGCHSNFVACRHRPPFPGRAKVELPRSIHHTIQALPLAWIAEKSAKDRSPTPERSFRRIQDMAPLRLTFQTVSRGCDRELPRGNVGDHIEKLIGISLTIALLWFSSMMTIRFN